MEKKITRKKVNPIFYENGFISTVCVNTKKKFFFIWKFGKKNVVLRQIYI